MTKNERRLMVENRIAGWVVEALLAAGYTIAVDNGEYVTEQMTDKWVILHNTRQTDEERLILRHTTNKCSFVYMVYGNGIDVISDYGVSLEPVMAEVMRKVDNLEKAMGDYNG